MKILNKILFVFLLVNLIVGCSEKKDFPKVKELKSLYYTNFVPTLEHKLERNRNSIYSPTILFAWKEIKGIFDNSITINSSYKSFNMINNSNSFVNVLNPNEYMNEVKINGSSIIVKSKFSKSLPFKYKLTNYNLRFNNKKVKAFGAFGNDENSKNIQILYYKNDSDFLLKLITKDQSNEIIIYRDNKFYSSMSKIMKSLNQKILIGKKEMKTKNKSWKYSLTGDDFVLIPKIKFNLETHYSNIEGNQFIGNNSKYTIETFWQQNAFILDEYGSKVMSKSRIMVKSAEEYLSKPKTKRMILDKPFFIILRKNGKTNPYFAIWVENEELLEIE